MPDVQKCHLFSPAAFFVNAYFLGFFLKLETGLEPATLCFEGEIHWGDEFSTIASCNAEPVSYVRRNLQNAQELALSV